MELYILIGLGIFVYVYLKRDNQRIKFEKVKEANRVCSYMGMGDVLFRIAQIQSVLKENGFLTEKEQLIFEALLLRRMKLEGTSTPEYIAEDLERFAVMERYRNFE